MVRRRDFENPRCAPVFSNLVENIAPAKRMQRPPDPACHGIVNEEIVLHVALIPALRPVARNDHRGERFSVEWLQPAGNQIVVAQRRDRLPEQFADIFNVRQEAAALGKPERALPIRMTTLSAPHLASSLRPSNSTKIAIS